MQNKKLLVDYIGVLEVSPQQINESMAQNDGRLIIQGILQRGSTPNDNAINQNGRQYPMDILKRECDKYKQVCDLDTGDCYTIRMKDGLIERVDNTLNKNKKIQVETKNGVKQLLNG